MNNIRLLTYKASDFSEACFIHIHAKTPLTRVKGVSGAGNRTRTDDLRITNALLYQLSHTSILNFVRPRAAVRFITTTAHYECAPL